MLKRKLSTIEMTVLGMTWLRGPCTIYSVMKELSASESTYHKSRAGTAYSIAKRLIQLGLVVQDADDRIRVTEEGKQAVTKWVGPDVPMMDVAHTADLLRLRFFFLELLSAEERLQFVDKALEKLDDFEIRAVDLIRQNQVIGDSFGALATLSIIQETRARKQWLRAVRSLVHEPLPDDADWTKLLLDRLTDERKER